MSGLVTERDLQAAETSFPGIEGLYQRLELKPPTFLDLLCVYWHDERDRIHDCHAGRLTVGSSSAV
jgi:hypothetical protein